MTKIKFRSFSSSALGSLVKRAVAPCLGLAFMTLSFQAQAQIRMVSPPELAFTGAVAQNGGFTAVGAASNLGGGVCLYEWGNLRLKHVASGTEFTFADLGNEVRLSNTWLAASAPGYNLQAGTGAAGAVLLSKRVSGSYGSFKYLVKDERIPANSAMSIAVSDSRLVIGSPNGLLGDGTRGAVLVFTYDASRDAWGSPEIIKANEAESDGFGSSVSIDGNRIAVGAQAYDNDSTSGGPGTGRVYVFDRSGTQWVKSLSYTSPAAKPEGRYGNKVDVHGDRLIVSAPSALESGLVEILERDATLGWRSRFIDHRRTTSVAIYADKAVVGLSTDVSRGTTSSNRLRTYRLIGSTWSAYGGMSGKNVGDDLGRGVDIHSGQVAASARGFDDGVRTDVGAAYLENFWGTSPGL